MLRVGWYIRTGIRGFKLPAIFSRKENKSDYNVEKRKEVKAYADQFDAENPNAPNPIRTKVPAGHLDNTNKIETAFHKSLHKSAIDAEGNITAPTYSNRRKLRKLFKRSPEPRELDFAPKPTLTHLANYRAMNEFIEDLGDRWKYPEEWDDYMEYAIENGVGLTPEKPHLIYSETSRAITSCICDPEMPFVNHHYVDINDGEPMVCKCGYYFKLEQMLVAPPMHQLMAIPDGGWFDPRLYNPDNHTYKKHPQEVQRQLENPPVKNLLEGLDLPKDSGLNVLDLAHVRYLEEQKMQADSTAPMFTIDYRQKPDGIKNYQHMEMRMLEGDDGSETFEMLLMPEDEEEAHLYLKGTPKPALPETDETKKIEDS